MSAPTDPILALRPADGTATALRDAIARTRAALNQAEADAERARAERDALLVDGSPAQLKAADAALLTGRDALERMGAMLGQLELRLAAADRAELLTTIEEIRVGWEAADGAYAAWQLETVPGLVTAITAGVTLHNATVQARRQWHELRQVVVETNPGAEVTAPVWDSPATDWIGALDDACSGFLSSPARTL